MKIYEVTFKVKVDGFIPEEDVLEWIRYHLNERGNMKGSNPLSENELDAEFGTVIVRRG